MENGKQHFSSACWSVYISAHPTMPLPRESPCPLGSARVKSRSKAWGACASSRALLPSACPITNILSLHAQVQSVWCSCQLPELHLLHQLKAAKKCVVAHACTHGKKVDLLTCITAGAPWPGSAVHCEVLNAHIEACNWGRQTNDSCTKQSCTKEKLLCVNEACPAAPCL